MELIGRKIFYSSREKMLAQTRRQIVLVGVIVVSVYLVWMFVSVQRLRSRSSNQQLVHRRTMPPQSVYASADVVNTTAYKKITPSSPGATIELCVAIPKYQDMVNCIHELNGQHRIADALVILVLAHNRAQYLKHVLASLVKQPDIKNVTLIVSHDGYYPDVVEMVRNITACRVVQLFHPYAANLHSVDVDYRTPEDWTPLHYNGSLIADPRFLQTAPKHHYAWAWNFVYRSPMMTTQQDFHVAYFEEDHYAAGDYLQTLRTVIQQAAALCPDCHVYNLGNHHTKDNGLNVARDGDLFTYSNHNNIGLVVSRQTYLTMLHPHMHEFCDTDEYNWDRTVSRMGQHGAAPEKSLTAYISRVMHIGQCGMHTHKKQECDPQATIDWYERMISQPLLAKTANATTILLRFESRWRDVPWSRYSLMENYNGWRSGTWDGPVEGGPKQLYKTLVHQRHCRQIVDTDLAWRLQ